VSYDRIDALVRLRAMVLASPRHGWPHGAGCPEKQQAYWRMRPEYRRPGYGPDRPCSCGLHELLGIEDGE
jgi:hypothetical protein